MRLVLFDIDGTLVDCGPQVRPLFGAALVEVFGTAGHVDGYDFVGKTDPQIVLDLMTGAGLEREAVEAVLPRFRELYLERLGEGLTRERMRLLPAVVELLERLAGRTERSACSPATGSRARAPSWRATTSTASSPSAPTAATPPTAPRSPRWPSAAPPARTAGSSRRRRP